MVRLFPTPSGKYSVGFTDITNEYGKDRLLVRLFYPTEENSQPNSKPGQGALWVEDFNYVKGIASFFGLPRLASFVNWFISDLKVPASKNAPLTTCPGSSHKFPVTVFSHGLGGNRFIYSSTCIDLASHGVVVAAVEHSDESASATYYLDPEESHEKRWIDYRQGVAKAPNQVEVRNAQVRHRAKECSKMLSFLKDINDGSVESVAESDVDLLAFKGKLDLERSALAGHSFGGATVVATIAEDNRFKVCVGMDVWTLPLSSDMYQKVRYNIPLLFINTETFHWPANIADIRKMDADTCPDQVDRVMTTIRGTTHQAQSDSPYFFNSTAFSKLIKLRGETDPELATKLNNSLLISFIGKHLGLSCAREVSDVVEENSEFLFIGSNIEVDEERVKMSKKKLSNEHAMAE